MHTTTGSPADAVYCGIDVGTSGVRAVLVASDGRHRGTGTAPIRRDRRVGEEHEQWPADWWDALVAAVRQALAEAAEVCGPVRVEALAVDATSGTVVVQRGDGAAVGPALMYDDTRAAPYASRAQSAGAGLWDQLGYRIQPSWSLPKILWMLDRRIMPARARIVHQADYLVGRLAGNDVPTDTSTALKSGVDARIPDWPRAVFDDLGIPVDLLPEVVLPGRQIAAVGPEAARATGLPAGTPIRAGMTDGCAAQIAAGALRAGSWSSALGTTLVIKGTTDQLLRDPSGAVYSHRHPDGGWMPGGASSSGAGAITAQFPGLDAAALDALTKQAADLIPFPGVTYPLVGVGERFPFSAPDAHGLLAEQAVTAADRFAALCQAIAYVERLAYDVLGVLGADVTGPVSLSGGAARNDWFNQLRADVLGRPTLLPASVEAATGMAVLAAAPPGALAETAAAMVRIERGYTPDPERAAMLRPGYRRLLIAVTERGWLDDAMAQQVWQRTETP